MKSNPADSGLLGRLAGAVADGEGVDWPAAHKEFEGTDLAGVVRGLETLAERAADISSSAGSTPGPADPRRSLPGWFVLYGVLVVLQLALVAFGVRQTAPAQSIAAWTFGVAGLLLVQRPPFETRRLALAGIFLSLAGAATEQLVGAASELLGAAGGVVRALPPPEVLLPYFLWWFVRLFPRTRHISWADRVAAVAMRVAGATAALLWVAGVAAMPGFVRGDAGRAYWPVLFVLCIPALVVMWIRRREAPLSEQRRVSLFSAGLGLGVGPVIAIVIVEAALPSVARLIDRLALMEAMRSVVYLSLLTIPVTTAYAARGGTILSVPALGRHAARRALGRVALTSVALGAFTLLVVRLVNNGLDAAAVALGGVVAIGAGLLLFRRQAWRMLGLRGTETWSDLITALGYELSSQPLPRAAAVVEPMLAGMLRVDVALMLRSGDGAFSAAGRDVPRLETQQALPLLLFQERTALVVAPDANAELFSCLPDADRQWLRASRAGVLVPVQGASGAVGLLALSNEAAGELDEHDLRGLEAVASSLALAFASRAVSPVEADVPTASECLACGVVSAASLTCTCGGALLPSAIPRDLNGKFHVIRRLGRGGMGVVYLGRDLQLDRDVALKTMPRVTAEASRRLRGEARAMAAVRHPHVAQIHGLESWCGVPVLVLEYLSGGMLNTRLQQPLDARSAVDLVLALASGLEAVHAAGLLHRDIKPSNIGFDANGTARLTDFGLSRLSPDMDGALSGSAEIGFAAGAAGTPLYMSPAVLDGAEPGPADDVWSLLVVLYECLAGSHPLRGLARESLRDRLLEGLPDLGAPVPPNVAAAVRSGLRPGGCPASASSLRAFLALARP